MTLQSIAELCVGGGWPANINTQNDLLHEPPLQYMRSLVDEDISRYDNVERDPVKMELLLRSLARNNQTLVSKKTLLADIGQMSEAALLCVSEKLVARGAQAPKSMVIVSGTVPYAYTTERGIKVVPIGSLGA